MESALIVSGIPFYDAPASIEGSPYWVDLWTEINGYMLGLQVKPKTYSSSSMSIYTGKAKSAQKRGFERFRKKYGGRVFIVFPTNGQLDEDMQQEIVQEHERLSKLPKGPFSYTNY